MKKEIRDRNRTLRDRVKELEKQVSIKRGENDSIMRQGQALQQKIAVNNTEILKLQGAIEELKRQIA